MKPFTRAHLLAFAWTTAILAACSIPGGDLPEVDLISLDKVGHAAMFAGYGWLWLRALHGPPGRNTAGVLATGLAYAALSEVYQGLLPLERTPDPLDALANALGLIAAVGMYRILRGEASLQGNP